MKKERRKQKSFCCFVEKKLVGRVVKTSTLILNPFIILKVEIHDDSASFNPVEHSSANYQESDGSILHALLLLPRFNVLVMRNCVVTGGEFLCEIIIFCAICFTTIFCSMLLRQTKQEEEARQWYYYKQSEQRLMATAKEE